MKIMKESCSQMLRMKRRLALLKPWSKLKLLTYFCIKSSSHLKDIQEKEHKVQSLH